MSSDRVINTILVINFWGPNQCIENCEKRNMLNSFDDNGAFNIIESISITVTS